MNGASYTRVVPLGGLGEVGGNALALESADDLVLIDCGLLFPQAAHPGVDYLTPDLGYLLERRHKLRGVLLTHGHEDHIGAVPHLLREVRVPVYGTRLTTALLGARLEELGPSVRDCLHTVVPGTAVTLGGVRAEFLRVAHSIPDACAVGLEVPGGRVLHSGDFTFDPHPVAARRSDEAALQRWGESGVDLLCCDSTNALRRGTTSSEEGVGKRLRELFAGVPGRIYVTLFSSNVGRVQQVLEASRDCGRRVTTLGRALTRSARLARQYGYLRSGPGDWVAEVRCRGLPRRALTVVLGGSQAEPGSALWRVARGMEPHHRLQPGDAVVFSSREIPGNEAGVHKLMNRCVGAGARVYCGDRDGVHVSGHPAADDVLHMLRLVRPRQVLPVHGELRHLDGLARLARKAGWAEDRALPLRNGQTLVLEQGRARPGEAVSVGRVCVERGYSFAVDDPLLPARRRMGSDGAATAVVEYCGEQAPARIAVVFAGVCGGGGGEQSARQAESALAEYLDRESRREPPCALPDEAALQRVLRGFCRRNGLGRPFLQVRLLGRPGGDGEG